MNHIGGVNEMIDRLKRELNAAKERITQLEQENDALRADLLLWENGGPLP